MIIEDEAAVAASAPSLDRVNGVDAGGADAVAETGVVPRGRRSLASTAAVRGGEDHEQVTEAEVPKALEATGSPLRSASVHGNFSR